MNIKSFNKVNLLLFFQVKMDDPPIIQFYCCPQCDFKTIDYNMFYEHLAYVHDLLGHISSQLPTFDEYVQCCCPQCDFRTLDSVMLQDHLKVHQEQNQLMSDNFIEVKTEPPEPFEVKPFAAVDIHEMNQEMNQATSPTKKLIMSNQNRINATSKNPRIILPEPIKLIEKAMKADKSKEMEETKECHICNKVMSSEALKRHLRRTHPSKETIEQKQQNIQCYFCGLESKNKADIKDHIKLIHMQVEVTLRMYGYPRTQHQCSQCKVVFSSDTILKLHICGMTNPSINITGDASRIEECPICKGTFKGHMSLLNHYAALHGTEKKFHCDQCDFKTFTDKHLSIHIKTVHSEDLICEICEKPFKNVNSLHKHIKEVHLKQRRSNKIVKCKVCDFQNVTYELRKHMKEVHPEFKPFNCDDCDQSFALSMDLWSHKKHCNLDPLVDKVSKYKRQKYFICTLCERMVTQITKLKEHMELEHQIDLYNHNKYACAQCPKLFTECLSLNQHVILEHELTSNFQCSNCDESLVSNILLTAHMIESHDFDPTKKSQKVKKEVKSFECDVCGSFFKSKDTLQIHKRQIHETDKHDFKCDQCNYTTFRESELRKHCVAKHTPKECPHCEYSSDLSKDMKEHLIKHRRNPLQCSECERAFPSTKQLQDHMLNEHNTLNAPVQEVKPKKKLVEKRSRKEYQAAYYAKHKEKLIKKQKLYNQNHAHERAVYNAEYNASQKAKKSMLPVVKQEVLEDPSDTTYDNIPIENQVFIETTDHIDIKNEPVDEY